MGTITSPLNLTCNWLSIFATLKVSCVTLLISTIMLFGYSPIHNSLTYFTYRKYRLVKVRKLTSTMIVSDTNCRSLITGSTDILGVIGGTESEHACS